MLLWLLIALGEFFSSPVLAIADGYTLKITADNPKELRTFIYTYIKS